MSDPELAAKEAYFQAHALLDLSDDESDAPNESVRNLERALEDSKPKSPPPLLKHTSSFLGPTPKERQIEFEGHTKKRRVSERQLTQKATRSLTAPEPEPSESLQTTRPPNGAVARTNSSKSRMKRTISLTQLLGKEDTLFYKRVGAIPRELRHGKNAKPANNIKLEPEHKQLLKDKIIYFYPNDDISMARRRRIHKVIQLGAAWANVWSDSVTHIMLDDDTYTCSQLMRHLSKPIPTNVVLVKFDPYVPQCIMRGELLDPGASYFIVKGDDRINKVAQTPEPALAATPVQSSPHIRPSKRQMVTRGSQKTDSYATEESVPSTHPAIDAAPSSPLEDIVEDSFIMPSAGDNRIPEPQTTDHFGDALSQAIQETRALAHLPLDDDDDGDAETPESSDVESVKEVDNVEESLIMDPRLLAQHNIVSKASALRNKKPLNMNAFQCMNPSISGNTSHNPNARTIQILDEMCKHYDRMQDQWRTMSYRKCIATLKKQNVKITTAKQAAGLPFIGPRLAAKIEEIVLTDRLRRLDSTRTEPLDVVLHLFTGVYGAGLVQANKWMQAGYRTLEDVKAKAKLSESQRLGIEHYADFNSRIPRAEVEAHAAIVAAALQKIDPKFSTTIMGSYRRGAQDSGDIDLILTRPNTSLSAMRTVVFEVLIPHLYELDFLKASLATRRSNDSSGSKWLGASCLPGSSVWRRIDFLLVPEDEMGAALLYFTGNDIFNRSMRLLARTKGMRLNQKGLYTDVQRGRRAEKLNEGVLVEGRCEKRIFDILGVPWKEPHERAC